MPHIYGVSPVLEALRAGGRPIERILIAEGARPWKLREVVDSARRLGIPVRREPRSALDRLSGDKNHQGVIAIAGAAGYADADALIAAVSADTLLVLLDGVQDPQNLGAIIRTAECAGATGIVIPERRSAHLTEAAAKASAGALEHLPVARVTNLAAFIETLKKRNLWVVAVDQSATKKYDDYDFTGPVALVLGGEGHGLHRLVRERCDAVVSIPLKGRISSLNVSVAAGIVLFEVLRQRSRKADQTGT